MNSTLIRRTLASTLTAVVVTGIGALTMTEPASALTVSTAWDGGTDVTLDAVETNAAISGGIYATSGMCSNAINTSLQSGSYFSDWARTNCKTLLVTCAQDAHGNGRALSAVRFYATTYKCLVR
jgi:hypothetical protein